jgi:hypothetical protein
MFDEDYEDLFDECPECGYTALACTCGVEDEEDPEWED